jgi:RimJ/RimL family protein N-acetyltransferase
LHAEAPLGVVLHSVVVPIAWPVFDLRVTTPRLTLRLPVDVELMRLAERAAGRVLSQERAGFMAGWTQIPSPEFERTFMAFHWRLRASWIPSDWHLDLGIYPVGEELPVGCIGALAREFARTRSASTGSWLLPEWRGQGLGKEARAAILHLLFDGLEAVEARSGAHPENAASIAVSRGLGYRADGTERIVLGDGQAIEQVRLLLRRQEWTHRADITIDGLDGCRDMFGL